MIDAMASGREEFSPDASYPRGPFDAEVMRFVLGAAPFAVRVRSKDDYGPVAERADDFAADTLVIWEVDTEAELAPLNRSAAPGETTTDARGVGAEGEPAVAGSRMPLDGIFGGTGRA